MIHARRSWAVTALLLLPSTGCAVWAPASAALSKDGGNAALFRQYEAYSSKGHRLTLADVAARCDRSDVVFFGERHNDVVCNQLEAQLLAELMKRSGHWSLSMEFFEADTQPDLSAYLARRLDEGAFRKRSRTGRRYATSHRPMIELCRVVGVPVIAANAPRALVRAFRKFGDDYEGFRASRSAEEQRWLPRDYIEVDDAYRERFFAIMSGHGPSGGAASATDAETGGVQSAPQEMKPVSTAEPSAAADGSSATESSHGHGGVDLAGFYRSQLLWDNAMADAIATHRRQHASQRVFHIVGGFHVASDGGLVQAFGARQPGDRKLTILYISRDDGFAYRSADRGKADVLIYGMGAGTGSGG